MSDPDLQPAEPTPPPALDSYLVVRKGPVWREIYRLASDGTVVTVGRDPSNQIVLPDERCSRSHCAVFSEGNAWYIRDLGSSNGTTVNGTRVADTASLDEGAIVRLGATDLLFTHELSRSMDEPTAGISSTTRLDGELEEPTLSNSDSKSVILDRKSVTRFVSDGDREEECGGDVSMGGTFVTLYRLIAGMLSASDARQAGETVLDGLLPAIDADIGAVLLFPENVEDRRNPANLRIVAYRAPEALPYRRVSTRLSTSVLEAGEGILARDISATEPATDLESLHEIAATSVLCVPLRHDGLVHGVLHVYCRHGRRQLDGEALELALAVGDHLAGILVGLNQKESLTASLRRAEDQNKSLSQLLEIESDLVGDSRPMRELRDSIARVAASDATVLIRGESGVGKELVSRAVHFNSQRREGPFICVNCAALTETLLESELFGHEKGAFTGATERKAGKFEQASGGTLFLDEVGEMSPSIQAKFLRVLEGQSFERVGGHTAIQVDVRIVAATNRNLEEAAEAGEFRRDLLYRLQVIELYAPRLSEHAEDVPLLARHLLDRACRRLGRPSMELTQEAVDKLCAYPWPGNVRELRNVIERAVVLHGGLRITPAELLFSPLVRPAAPDSPEADPAPVSLDELEQRHILKTLERTKWNKREAARILGINRSTLDRKLQKYETGETGEAGDWRL